VRITPIRQYCMVRMIHILFGAAKSCFDWRNDQRKVNLALRGNPIRRSENLLSTGNFCFAELAMSHTLIGVTRRARLVRSTPIRQYCMVRMVLVLFGTAKSCFDWRIDQRKVNLALRGNRVLRLRRTNQVHQSQFSTNFLCPMSHLV
jgi:hypothetical protein